MKITNEEHIVSIDGHLYFDIFRINLFQYYSQCTASRPIWSVLEGDQLIPPTITYAHGFIGLKFREDFKQLVYNVNVNNIDNITGIYVYSHGDNTKNASMLIRFLGRSKGGQSQRRN